MKYMKFLLVGIFFGIVLVKSEAVSWYRIYEMFRFQSFHMYGIIGTAIFSGILFLELAKRDIIKSISGKRISVPKKDPDFIRYIFGGILFGLGWGLIGACPGPLYVLLGTGVLTILIPIAAAILGTFVYGLIRHKLPH